MTDRFSMSDRVYSSFDSRALQLDRTALFLTANRVPREFLLFFFSFAVWLRASEREISWQKNAERNKG